jgi:alpha-beta hydrolase superfamily lysophospholipase/DNA-binding CsgD family transcriptional regulator
MEAKYLPRPDGPSLYYRHWPVNMTRRFSSGKKSVFLGHSQPTHSGMLQPLAAGFRASGWDVHSGDIRGHGRSFDRNSVAGHLDPRNGWKSAVDDMRHLLERSFAGIPWQDRLIVVPNITALLTLEVMKTWPDLAQHIVFISPPPNQKTLALFGKTFAEVRIRLKGAETPDEQILHHLYSFLGAHLKDRRHLADVMSTDHRVIQHVLEDPHGWPTPTPAYWKQIFEGMLSSWSWPRDAVMKPGTRCLVVFGGEDAMLRGGGFLPPIQRFLSSIGIEDIAAERVDGARSALFLEEEKFSISKRILDWVQKTRRPETEISEVGVEELASDILNRISETGARQLEPDELVELCYNAIEDDSRWTEIIYRMIHEAERSGDVNEEELHERISRLMPHWERAFNLNKQVMMSATLGVLLESVIERLQIGVALLDRQNDLLHSNGAFEASLTGLFPQDAESPGQVSSKANVHLLLSGNEAAEAAPKNGERLIVHDGRPVGFQFFPAALKQTSLQRHGPASLLLLRVQTGEDTSETRRTLIELAYGLTGKEAEIALEIAEGHSLDEIADKLGILVSTARGHLKKSFQKIGVHSQSELAARLMAGPIGWLK